MCMCMCMWVPFHLFHFYVSKLFAWYSLYVGRPCISLCMAFMHAMYGNVMACMHATYGIVWHAFMHAMYGNVMACMHAMYGIVWHVCMPCMYGICSFSFTSRALSQSFLFLLLFSLRNISIQCSLECKSFWFLCDRRRNNHFGGWMCQKWVPFYEVISGVVVHKVTNRWHWAASSSEPPTIQSHWPFKVWTMSNQILLTNSVGEAITSWKTREHWAFQM